MGKDSKKKDSKDKHKSSKKEHKHESKHSKKDHKSHHSSKDKVDSAHHTGHSDISEDDFFVKSEAFRVWLKIERNIYFEDLTSADARKLFDKDFVKYYNKGKLDAMYYAGKLLGCFFVAQCLKSCW
jgi:hypothetical protein